MKKDSDFHFRLLVLQALWLIICKLYRPQWSSHPLPKWRSIAIDWVEEVNPMPGKGAADYLREETFPEVKP